MKLIRPVSMTIGNFRSYKTVTTFKFDTEGGLIYVCGDNQVESRLGSNGAGKSTLFKAAHWCLFGTDDRSVRSSDLVSWGKKVTKVELELLINDAPITITRTAPPNKLLLDGEPIEQRQLEILLGRTQSQFKRSVLFGQKVPMFLDLSLPERAELLNDTLQLDCWDTLSQMASEDANKIRANIVQHNIVISRIEGHITALSNTSQLRTQATEWAATQNNAIQEAISAVEAAEIKENMIRIDYQESLLAQAPNVEPIKKEIEALDGKLHALNSEIAVDSSRVGKLQEELLFFKKHTTCPVCTTTLSPEFIATKIKEKEEEIAIVNWSLDTAGRTYNENIVKKEALTTELRRILDAWAITVDRRNKLLRELDAASYVVSHVQKEAEKLLDSSVTNPFTARLSEMEKEATDQRIALTDKRKEITALEGRADAAEFWKAGFKRVRLFEMKRITSLLETEINSAASILGLVGWRIEVKTETETKSGTTKNGVQVVIHSPIASAIWEAWSGGESQRIQLAVTIGLTNMIERSTATKWNFEIWDEPAAWLSVEGINDMLETLEYRACITNKPVYIVDHRSLSYGGFAKVFRICKDAERGSYITLEGE